MVDLRIKNLIPAKNLKRFEIKTLNLSLNGQKYELILVFLGLWKD